MARTPSGRQLRGWASQIVAALIAATILAASNGPGLWVVGRQDLLPAFFTFPVFVTAGLIVGAGLGWLAEDALPTGAVLVVSMMIVNAACALISQSAYGGPAQYFSSLVISLITAPPALFGVIMGDQLRFRERVKAR